MRNIEDVPYLPGEFHRIGAQLFADAMCNVMQVVDGVEEDQAMRIVDAVIGPLLLISPPPYTWLASQCGHRYYHERDGWLYCTKDHEATDDDPHAHGNDVYEVYWDDDQPEHNIRAFAPAKESWR